MIGSRGGGTGGGQLVLGPGLVPLGRGASPAGGALPSPAVRRAPQRARADSAVRATAQSSRICYVGGKHFQGMLSQVQKTPDLITAEGKSPPAPPEIYGAVGVGRAGFQTWEQAAPDTCLGHMSETQREPGSSQLAQVNLTSP